jgi:hypothetical protein
VDSPTAQHVNKGKAHQLLQQTSVFEYRFDDDTNLQLLKLYHRRELQHLRLDCPRNGGSKAAGRVKAISNTSVTVPAGTKITVTIVDHQNSNSRQPVQQ